MKKAIVFVLTLLILCGALVGCAAQGGRVRDRRQEYPHRETISSERSEDFTRL